MKNSRRHYEPRTRRKARKARNRRLNDWMPAFAAATKRRFL